MSTDPKSIASSLLPEFDLEMAGTRKVLERVKDEDWAFKPTRSRSRWASCRPRRDDPGVADRDAQRPLVRHGPGRRPGRVPRPGSAREALALFLEGVKAARAALEATADPAFAEPWSLLENGKVWFTMPRSAVVRGFVMNHLIHHRAQLTVYLRLRDVPVPALYGPSADES
jgi:DinB family.